MIFFVHAICYVIPWLSFCVKTPRVIPVPDYYHVPVDGFKAMGRLPEVVAAYTSSDCPSYLCLSSSRTQYDVNTRQVSYMWKFAGINNTMTRNSEMEIQFGSSLDEAGFYIDGDECHNFTGYASFSDYQTCLVTVAPYYQDNMCILWVIKPLANQIPKPCMDAFRVACGEGYRDYSDEMCQTG
ncbi:uncharacterized protein LOC144167092 [Haemaphysalis longicornis]